MPKKNETIDTQESLQSKDRAQPQAGVNDPFDPSRLKVSQDFIDAANVKRKHTSCKVGRPDKQAFFRVRPGEENRMTAAVIEVQKERGLDSYLVLPELLAVPEIQREASPRIIVTGIDRANEVFLWPLKLPSGSGQGDSWSQSCLEAAMIAETSWIRLQANMSIGMYMVLQAESILPEPSWPELNFPQLLKLGFKDRLIDSIDHEVIQKLRGLK